VFAFWLVVIGGQLLLQFTGWPTQFYHKNQVDYLAYPMSTTTVREITPTAFTFDLTEKTSDQPEIISGTGELTAWTRLNTGAKDYTVTCISESCLVVEPTANFAGFQTQVDGERVAYVDDEIIRGRLAFSVGAGEHVIKTRFTQNTWPRLLGNSLSLVCGLVVVYKFVSQWASFSRRAKSSK
jgi:hypothetical protein